MTLAVVLDQPNTYTMATKSHLLPDERRLMEEAFNFFGVHLPDPREVYFTFAIPNILASKPQPNEIAIYHDALMKDLAAHNVTKVLAVGTMAHAVVTKAHKLVDILQIRGLSYWVDLGPRKVFGVSTLPMFYILRAPDTYRDWIMDLNKLFRWERPFNMPPASIVVTDDMAELDFQLHLMNQHHSIISCDLETNGFFPRTDPILSIGLGSMTEAPCINNAPPGRITIVPVTMVGKPEIRERLRQFFNEWAAAGKRVVFHNAKFDMQFLRAYFGEVIDHWHIDDTMLLNYMLDERPIGARTKLTISPHGLKTLSRVYFDSPEYKLDLNAFLKQPHTQRNYKTLYQYQAMDVVYTIALYWRLKYRIDNEQPEMWPVYRKLLQPAIIPFMEAELHGTPLDRPYLQKLDDAMVGEIAQIKTKLQQIAHGSLDKHPSKYAPWTGDPDIDKEWEWTIHWSPKEFNPNSPRQVAFMLYKVYRVPDVTKLLHKKPNCTDKDVMNALLGLHQAVQGNALWFLKGMKINRETVKIRSTYTKGLLDASVNDSRAHPQFMLNGTATGRLSCHSPNLFNQPARMGNKIRRAFCAPPGYKLIAADYSQLELRIAALVSQDPGLIQVFVDDRDIHTEVAARMFQILMELVTKDQRHVAKYVDFGWLYGRGAQSIAEKYGYTIEFAQGLLDAFENAYPKLKQYRIDMQHAAWNDHVLTTLMGRKRRFPFITKENRADIGRQALNFPIQSLASDFCLNAYNNLYWVLKGSSAQLLFTVYDATYTLVKEDEALDIAKVIEREMTQNLPIECNVPIKVDVHISQRWDEEDRDA